MNVEMKQFIEKHKPLSYAERIVVLKELRDLLNKYEPKLIEALKHDLNRSESEVLITEIYPIYKEINYFIKNLKKLMKPKKVRSFLGTIRAKNYVEKRPYGVMGIISPWNYPINLSLTPVVGALAAGNNVILKPSQYSKQTTETLTNMLNELTNFVFVLPGGRESTNELLDSNINYVVFTGSTQIGKHVAQKCASNLIPYTLELGGKSPCIITNTCNMKVAAKRIVWGKFLNMGQTCVAPDYILVQENKKQEFMKILIDEIKLVVDSKESFGKIITDHHFERLLNLINNSKEDVVYQQAINEKLILGMTVIEANVDSEVMKEEIFGPILPILSYKCENDAIKQVEHICKNPLALYLFTSSQNDIEYFANNILSGGMVINDVIMQINNNKLPFGGVGASGMGKYHGKHSFETFSHTRSILKNTNSL